MVREFLLRDKYPVAVYVYYNTETESYTLMLTVRVIILEHPMSGIVLNF